MDRRQVGLRAMEGWTSQRLLRMKTKYREQENLKWRKSELWIRWTCVHKEPSSSSNSTETRNHQLCKTTGSSWFLLEEEWDFALPYAQPLTYIKHPESSFPFLFSDFRSWQVSKLSTEILILTLQCSLTAAGGKREGFPGLYWTIG